MKNYLFDAFPLLCWLQEEPGHELVEDLLTQAEEDKIILSLHIINLGEIFYRVYRLARLRKAGDIIKKLRLLPIKIVSVSDGAVMEAAEIKGKYPISYADAFAVATALQTGATLVTGDPQYKVVSKMIKILWVK
jgi:ribonuclease VapC